MMNLVKEFVKDHNVCFYTPKTSVKLWKKWWKTYSIMLSIYIGMVYLETNPDLVNKLKMSLENFKSKFRKKFISC